MALVEGLVAQAGGAAPRLDRIDGPDRTGAAWAVVDSVGRFVDLGLGPGWWAALGPARVASGLLEALECARMKAALVPMILRRHGVRAPSPPPRSASPPLPAPTDAEFLDAARGRIADAYRLIDEADKRLREMQTTRIITGPRGLFRLHVRGTHLDHAEVGRSALSPADTDRLVADARDVLHEVSLGRGPGSN
ncbi:MAG: hypothetical protein ABW046_13355 [Actinoplanes sp.]